MKFNTLLLILLFGVSMQAQITITNSVFPQAGDILETNLSIDSTASISASSTLAQTWDFSSLLVLSNELDTVGAASDGASFSLFPSADILQELFPGFGGIAYVDVTASQMVKIGGAFEFFGIAFANPYTNSHITQEVPLTYPDVQSDDYEVSLAVNIDSVPFLRTLLDSIAGALSNTADSIRIRFTGEESRVVDAFGNCTVLNGSYDVIRQEVTTVLTASIDIHINAGFFSYWQDISGVLGSALPVPLPNNDTTVYYDYLSNSLKQPLARFYTDSTLAGVDRVIFYQGDSLSSTISIDKIQRLVDVSIFPNPSQGQLQISIEKLDEPVYVTVVDPACRVVKQFVMIDKQQTFNIQQLSPGMYHVILEMKMVYFWEQIACKSCRD